jgi:hypothetical protein
MYVPIHEVHMLPYFLPSTWARCDISLAFYFSWSPAKLFLVRLAVDGVAGVPLHLSRTFCKVRCSPANSQETGNSGQKRPAGVVAEELAPLEPHIEYMSNVLHMYFALHDEGTLCTCWNEMTIHRVKWTSFCCGLAP